MFKIKKLTPPGIEPGTPWKILVYGHHLLLIRMPWYATPIEDRRHNVLGSVKNTRSCVQKYYFHNLHLKHDPEFKCKPISQLELYLTISSLIFLFKMNVIALFAVGERLLWRTCECSRWFIHTWQSD